LAGAVQGSLFTPNVIAMPNRVAPRPPRPRANTAAGGKAAGSPGSASGAEGQGEFEFFEPVQTKAKTLGTTVDAVIYCEAPVATPLHRAVAAAIDLTMILVGYGLFLLTFLLCGGAIVVNRPNLIIFGGALGLIAATYGLFWTVAGTESVGMRDAFTPDHLRRFHARWWQRVTRLGRHVPESVFGAGDFVVPGRRRRLGLAGSHFADLPHGARAGIARFSKKVGSSPKKRRETRQGKH
jgi:hypothetical protein